MKYDIVIIGGGLSGLTAGIALSKRGKRVCIVSAGQNSLHFGSGSFDLLATTQLAKRLPALSQPSLPCPKNHPYHLVGDDRIADLAANAKQLLADAGIVTVGDAQENHYRITPIGAIKPTWLTIDGMATARSLTETKWKQADLVNNHRIPRLPITVPAREPSEFRNPLHGAQHQHQGHGAGPEESYRDACRERSQISRRRQRP
jgi:glycerol-3-phosphate dehydrogenase subunit B